MMFVVLSVPVIFSILVGAILGWWCGLIIGIFLCGMFYLAATE